MDMLRTVIRWGWSPILITALAIIGIIYEWEVWALIPALVVILIIGLVVAVVDARERQLELMSVKLRQLAGYFNRRFTGSSSLSIFVIIDSLFTVDNPKLWEWARACDMSQRLYNSWFDSFIGRVEGDIRTRRFDIYLRIYLNEFWLLNNHYHEFVEQFYEVAQSVELSRETVDQYNRFVMEYNSFVQNFRDTIAELKKAAKTEIEPPSVQTVRELARVEQSTP